jgi:hypothetical protein
MLPGAQLKEWTVVYKSRGKSLAVTRSITRPDEGLPRVSPEISKRGASTDAIRGCLEVYGWRAQPLATPQQAHREENEPEVVDAVEDPLA